MDSAMRNEIFDAYRRLSGLLHLEVLEHGLFSGDRNWNFARMSSPFNRLYFLLEGAGCLEGTEGRIDLRPGSMYLIPMGSVYDYRCDESIRKFYVHFRIGIADGPDLFEATDRCLARPFDAGFLLPLLDGLRDGRPAAVLRLDSLLLACIADFLPLLPENAASALETVSRHHAVFRTIRDSCRADLSPAEVARALGQPLRPLAETFRKDTGRTLRDQIRASLVRKAKDLLLTTDQSIREIAYALRFDDEFYFSRFFKRRTGFSPRQYRDRHRMGRPD